jgi:16S rRNA (adenine1518-N6/adenine1519-N6)-dimethyltransferase
MEHPKNTLGRHGLAPKKSLGQNFIYDERILARIVDAADVSTGDQVLEIGPGLGSLTLQLAQKADQIVAVELDDRLLPILEQQIGPFRNVEIVHADILELDPARYLAGDFKAIGNVPYYITGAILRHLLSAMVKPEITVMTVQQEVAERIVALPGKMSLLAVMAQFYAQAEMLFKIKAGAFWPKPDVDSAVLRMNTHALPLLPRQQEDDFFRLVRVGFSQKRKQLQKNLRALGLPRDRLEQAFLVTGIEGQRRAQTLSVDEWCALHAALL